VPQSSVGSRLQINTDYIAGLTSINGINVQGSTYDSSTLDDLFKTYVGGTIDPGEMALGGHFEAGDTDGQIAMWEALKTRALTPFIVNFPNGSATWNVSGVVNTFTVGAELDGLIPFEATVKISGEPSLGLTPSAGLSGLSLTGTGGSLAPTFDNAKTLYTFGSVSATSVTVTATAVSHTLQLFIDGVFSQNLVSGSASAAIPLTLNVGKKLTIIAFEANKTQKVYDIAVLKTS
jgi:hypothetical protein